MTGPMRDAGSVRSTDARAAIVASHNKLILPRWNCRKCASACPDHCRRNAIFHRRACVRQIAIFTVQLVGHIANCSADPMIIKAADDELLAICERDNLCRFINPEAKILFGWMKYFLSAHLRSRLFLLGNLGNCELTRAPSRQRKRSGAARILEWCSASCSFSFSPIHSRNHFPREPDHRHGRLLRRTASGQAAAQPNAAINPAVQSWLAW